MGRTAIQLYTLRGIDEPLPALLESVAETTFDGVEFAHRVADANREAVVEALGDTGLAVAAAHVGLETLETDYEGTTALYEELGCTDLVVPWLDPSHFESEAAIAEVAERLNAVAQRLAEDGFSLHYHNHDQEFVDRGEHAAMDELLARTDDSIGFELDLGWANAAGADPVALLDRYGDRISHVHFADADAESMACVELGEGDLDLDACLEAARDAGVEWYIYEHDEPTDPRESLAHGAKTLDEAR
ncbi:sugar phosphate isomerase/epimerase [Halalkalicoccus sp. NIPERK01]|uniref:sugar phosphate isomerase/epimerase family protein n=1 Tax=Halalkalicoccus sp. NIPERK01 TaxID=3053469 RepID=UPI00256EA2B6|nr:sugar phosphate isomerase/epimerase [Halalkalicoccus sp. NIPERK01]MDL5360768.1 sugar phosphate isomerase/epimerase [Halalkalicoccus sp. NIPERK01]